MSKLIKREFIKVEAGMSKINYKRLLEYTELAERNDSRKEFIQMTLPPKVDPVIMLGFVNKSWKEGKVNAT